MPMNRAHRAGAKVAAVEVAVQAVDLPPDHLRQVDAEAWARALADGHTVEPVRLLEEEMFQNPPEEEAEVDVSWQVVSPSAAGGAGPRPSPR